MTTSRDERIRLQNLRGKAGPPVNARLLTIPMDVRNQTRDICEQGRVRCRSPARVIASLPSIIDVDVSEAVFFKNGSIQSIRLRFDILLIQKTT